MPELLSLARVHGDYWAIKPDYARGAVAYLQDANYEEHLAEYESRISAPTARQGDVSPDERPYRITGGTALISIDGVLTRKPTSYGGCSYILLQHAIRLAGRDQDVTSIALVVSSPGGSVNGLQELTDEIESVAKTKPITGYIPDGAFSAAYYALTACTKIVIERTAQCGSLGCMTTIVDSSEEAKQRGILVDIVSTGEIKGQGTPGTVPNDAYRKMVAGFVQDYGDFFKAAIVRGRSLPQAKVDVVFTGAYFMAKDALALGLVDSIGTLDDALAELQSTDPACDDEEDPAIAGTSETIVITDEQRAGLSAGITREQFATILPAHATTAVADPTISAPGGQPGSAGISSAPIAGAENQTGNTRMSFRQLLIQNLAVRGFGKMVAALNGTTSEDPEVIGRIVTDQVEAQAADLVASNPLITVAKAHGINDLTGFNALLDRARNGDQYLNDMKAEAKDHAVRAFGPDQGPIVGASVDGQSLAQVIASRNAWRTMADQSVGIKPDGSAPQRQTAPANAVATEVAQTNAAAERPWDKVEASTRDQAKERFKLDTPEKQDRWAASFLEGVN